MRRANTQEDHVVPTRLIAEVAGEGPAWRGPDEQETDRRGSRRIDLGFYPRARADPGQRADGL